VKHWLNNLARLQKKSKNSNLVRNFRVKGEVGCFTIPLYGDLEGFPPQRRLEHYRTSGYRQVILHQGIVKSSYRTVCTNFNHTVRQEQEQGIKPSGVRYEATVEARQIEAALLDKISINRYFHIVYSYSLQNGLQNVCNKRQKADRSSDTPAPIDNTNNRKDGKKVYKKRKQLYHTVAKVFTATESYTFTAPKIGLLWATLIAFLLHNGCLRTFWICLVDGQRSLHMYMGLKTNDRRDTVLLHVEQLLWYGLIDQAIEYINQIPKQQIKNQEKLTILIGYFEFWKK